MHTIVSRPLGSQSPTVIHGRYLLFEWPAARLQSARASHRRSTWRTGHLHQPGPSHHATRDITSFVLSNFPCRAIAWRRLRVPEALGAKRSVGARLVM
jgi:hypothetical protein